MGNSLPTQEGRQRASQGKRPSRCVDLCPCMVLIRRHMLRRVHPEVPPIRLIIDIFYRYVAETSSVGEPLLASRHQGLGGELSLYSDSGPEPSVPLPPAEFTASPQRSEEHTS